MAAGNGRPAQGDYRGRPPLLSVLYAQAACWASAFDVAIMTE
jgi:hypothetical protein